MSASESMENIPEKMKGLHINEVLAEAKRKLLKYQRKNGLRMDSQRKFTKEDGVDLLYLMRRSWNCI